MTTTTSIIQAKATVADIKRLVQQMESVLVGEREDHVMMACIAMALSIQYPDLTREELSAGVKGASEWMATYISTIASPVDKAAMN